MEIQLTRDTDKFICIVYKHYLEARKAGKSKPEAKHFPQLSELQPLLFPNTPIPDLVDCISEAGRAFNMFIFVDGSFDLSDEVIIYMENRFKKGLLEVVDFITKFF